MLTKNQILFLKSSAHDLKPVVMIGSKGLTDTVIEEINTSIEHHELMKIKVAGLNKDNRDEVIPELCKIANADFVQVLGSIVTIFRKNKKKSKYTLPKD